VQSNASAALLPPTLSFTTFAGPKYRKPKMASHDLRARSFEDGCLCSILHRPLQLQIQTAYNVVLAFMPGLGKANSASLGASLRSSFSVIKLGTVVGVCGGVPFTPDEDVEILLCDVIISTGLKQFDFRRQYPNKCCAQQTGMHRMDGSNCLIAYLTE
jgi:hypothetical protein